MNSQQLPCPANNCEFTSTYHALVDGLAAENLSLSDKLDLLAKAAAEVSMIEHASIWLLDNQSSTLTCKAAQRSCSIKRSDLCGKRILAQNYPWYFSALHNDSSFESLDLLRVAGVNNSDDSVGITNATKSIYNALLSDATGVIGVLRLDAQQDAEFWNGPQEYFANTLAELASQLLLVDQFEMEKAKSNTLFDNASAAILILDRYKIIDCNEFSSSIFGAEHPSELLGKSILELSQDTRGGQSDLKSIIDKAHSNSESTNQANRFNLPFESLDGRMIMGEAIFSAVNYHETRLLTVRIKDVTERIETAQRFEAQKADIEYKNLHDPLTGLPNRSHLKEHIKQCITEIAQQPGTTISLALFDINHFKEINDTLGHDIGDRLLVSISMRLLTLFTWERGRLYRLGGDEFAVVFIQDSQAPSLQCAEAINNALEAPFVVDDISLEVRAGVGVARFPEHGEDSEALLRSADVAMYAAKSQGEPKVLYHPDIDFHSTRRLTIMSELASAIENGELELYFQPRITLSNAKVCGCEALVRWPHPQLGMVSPIEFIPVAEITDLIHRLTHWVLDTAMRQARSWQARGIQIPIAVNLSARNLSSPELPQEILQLISKHELRTDAIELEITESALMNYPQLAIENLHQIHAMGFKLAIDDFGTGYSSLSYLKNLPIDVLKIDRSFVSDMCNDEGDRVIVTSTIDLAHSFALKVVAEGVEDAPTLSRLGELGCDEAQGYHLAKPMAAKAFEQWFTEYAEKTEL